MAKAKRVHRDLKRSSDQKKKEQEIRDRFQKERPSLRKLLADGEFTETRQGDYFDALRLLAQFKKWRQRRGLSLADVSKQTGMDRGFISRLENGADSNPTLSTMEKVARALGLKIELVEA
jgi:DNA-binding phage protein